MTIKVINAIHGSAAVSVGADWFGSDIVVGDLPCAKHTLQMMVSTATVVNLQLKNDTVTKVINLNSGTALNADAGYQFDILLRPGDTYNVQHATGETNTVHCLIVESDNTDI